jgi:hypothetical protein
MQFSLRPRATHVIRTLTSSRSLTTAEAPAHLGWISQLNFKAEALISPKAAGNRDPKILKIPPPMRYDCVFQTKRCR